MIAIIGDVHGCFYTLEALYNKILAEYPSIEVYSVGDLVDRGLNSYEVVKFFMDNRIKFTPGNHDYMFYDFIKNPDSLFARAWVYNGNEATLRSYLDHLDCIAEHVEFIRSAPLFYNIEDCFISHAGIAQKYGNQIHDLETVIMLEHKGDSGVLWTRERLLNLGKLQVVGHTSQREVRYDSTANAVYIDTGAFLGRQLSAVIIHKNEIIEVLAEPTHSRDLR